MDTEMLNGKELSDAQLEDVSGGDLLDEAQAYWSAFKWGVKQTVHSIAQSVADATK
jgi:hypothetical protein